MNLASGTLVFTGFITILMGVASKVMGIALLAPFIMRPTNYLIVGMTCLVVALVVDKFEKA